MQSPMIFQDADKVYYADTCEPLKAAARDGDLDLFAWSRGSYPGDPLPSDSLAEVRSIGVWDAPRHQTWGLDLHCNEGIEFTYIARGKVAFDVDGSAWNLRRGHLTITRPWQFHQVGNPYVTASRLYWLILDVNVRRPNQPWQWPKWLVCSQQDLQRLTQLLSLNEQPVWQANEDVSRSFAKLAELVEHNPPAGNETRVRLYINELIVAVMDMLHQTHIPLDEHLPTSHRVVELFLSRLPGYVSFEWSLDSMAAECGLSRSQFSTYCKQITNMSPVDYLTHCRIQSAAELLSKRPDLAITEVAFSCGFNSSQYFATVFRSHHGCTPREYRIQKILKTPVSTTIVS